MKDYSLHVSRYLRHLKSTVSTYPKIREARLIQKISASAAAEKMGWTKSGWYKAELRAQKGILSLNTLERMAKAVNCRVDIRIYPAAGFKKLELIDRHKRFGILR